MTSEDKERLLEELKKRKGDLIEQIRSIRALLRDRSIEIKTIDAVLAQKDRSIPASYLLKNEVEKLEFRIATEATSLTKEKLLIKDLRELERKLKQAEEIDKLKRTKMAVLNGIKNEEQRLNAISNEIDQINDEISASYHEISEERKEKVFREREKRRKQEKQERLDKDLEPYNQKFGELTLGDICVIKKKNS